MSMYADQAIAPAEQHLAPSPSASRGRAMWPAMAEPTLLPIPSPSRKTARISEKV